jgi:hypothetical protein
LGELCIASSENVDALEQWEQTCSRPTAEHPGGPRFADTLEAGEKTTAEIARALEKIGIANPPGPYLREEIGRWVTEDFAMSNSNGASDGCRRGDLDELPP